MVIWCSKSMLRLTLPRMISPARGRVQLFKLDHLFSITAPCLDMQETHSHLNNAEASVVPVVTAPHPCYSHTIIFFNSGRQSCLYWSRSPRGTPLKGYFHILSMLSTKSEVVKWQYWCSLYSGSPRKKVGELKTAPTLTESKRGWILSSTKDPTFHAIRTF